MYWLPTGREVFDPDKFDLPVEIIDAFGNTTTIAYDDHSLLVTEVEDPFGNTVEIDNDYRVLGPVLVTDPNGNRSAAKVDELGIVIATAVMGKVGRSDGDTLEDPTTVPRANKRGFSVLHRLPWLAPIAMLRIPSHSLMTTRLRCWLNA